MHSSHLSHSVDPSLIRVLNSEQQQRLADVLDRYLRALDDGVPPSPEALIAAHPDLAGPLQAYLEGLDQLHGIASGYRDSANIADDEERLAGFDRVRLGDFVLGREVGRGGMGVVYEAQQLSLNRRVALKVLPFAAIFDAKQIARFKNEAQAAAQLQHPNIVPVYAVGMERGVHYYAMQYIEGQPLDKAIAQLRHERATEAFGAAMTTVGHRSFSAPHDDDSQAVGHSLLTARTANRRAYIQTVIRLGIQAAEALHAAHEYGVVHRDIKPSNLLLDNEGKLWVTDFGLARFRSDGTLTRSGDVVGTMRYMSPEQAAGDTALVDHRTDIYALAVTLYELLTLQPAVTGQPTADALRAMDRPEPPRLRRIRPDIPKDLETVVRKGMAKARDERYATAQQFADDLQRVLAGEPTVAKPPTFPERAGKWMRRHRRLVASAVCICLLAAGGCALSTLLIARETVKADRNYQRAEKNFRAARDVLDRFGSQLAQRLADVPGAAQVRRQLLAETVQYYREFAEQAANDPQLQADLALTYSKIALLEEDSGSSSAALTAHESARDLYARLAADEPGNREHRRHLALCWNNLARVLARTGRVKEAYSAHNEAIRIQQQLVRESNEDAQCLSDLALSHNNLGLLQTETGETAAADKSFHEAIRLGEQLATRDSTDVPSQRALAASWNNLGGLYAATDLARAVAAFQTAVQQLESIAAAPAADLACRNELALSYSNLGSVQSQAGAIAEAGAAYQHAVDIQSDLVQAAPDQKSFRRDLSVSLNNQGLLRSKLGQSEEAEQAFRKALTLQESLVAQDSGNVALHSSLAGICNNLGIALEELQRFDQAAAAYKQAVDHQRVAFDRAATVARYRTFLSKHYYNYGRVLRKMGQVQEAIQVALARRDLWPQEPQHLLTVAEELALASSMIPDDAGGSVSKQQAVTLALDTLQQAIAAGLPATADIDTNESFATIRNEKRFVELVKK